MTIDLSGCRAKIERAWEHKNALETIVSPVKSEPLQIQISAELDPQSGYYVYRVAAIPEDWRLRVGIMIGDIIHNARSALDHLFWHLYCRYIRVPRTDGEARRVQVPIEDRSKGLSEKRNAFRKIPSSHWAIIDAAQPYKRRNKYRILAILRDLSNQDKHRVLTPILIRAETFEPVGEPFRARRIVDWDTSRAKKNLEVGAETMRVKFDPSPYHEAYVDVAGYLTPHVLLPQGQALTVSRGLSGMITCAEETINDVWLRL